MDNQKVQACALALFTLLVASTHGGNILVFPVDGSHWINMKILIEALHAKGHDVTVIRPKNSWYIKETSPFYTSITLPSKGGFDQKSLSETISKLLELQRRGSLWARLQMHKQMLDEEAEILETQANLLINMIEDRKLVQSLKDSRYDACLTDPALIGGVIVCHYLKLPLIYNVRWTLHTESHFAIAPSPLSYVPYPMLELSDHMSFFEKAFNVLMYFVTELQMTYFFSSRYNELCSRIIGPNVDYFELIQAADLWLSRIDFIFEYPRPTMPNIVYIGGFQCKPSKPLSQGLEDFVQGSGEHGVIVMSLGTFVEELPTDVTDAIAEAFAELPQKVVWRYKGQRPSTLGNNTLLMDWIPQNDLLGHPKTKAFVAHGGTNGIQEAIYHGVPIVGLGLIWDQPDNLAKMREKGVAKMVHFATMTKDSFLLTVKEILHEPSYRENMQRLSRLHKDVPVKPLDNAVFWIEYIMRHKGAAHLQTQSYKLPWYTYHSLDVLLFLMCLSSFFVFIIYLIVRQVCNRLCCGEKKPKSE